MSTGTVLRKKKDNLFEERFSIFFIFLKRSYPLTFIKNECPFPLNEYYKKKDS